MPQPKGKELGLRNPYSLRVGLDIEKFRGTNTHGDPGAIARDQFQALENVSFDGTRWGSRDGLSKVNSASAMSGCIYGMWDDDDGLGFGGGPVRVYGAADETNYALYAYDNELTTPSQQYKTNPLESLGTVAILAVHDEFAAVRLGAVSEDEVFEEQGQTRLIIGGRAGRVYEWPPTSPPEGRTLLDTATYPKHTLTVPGLSGTGLIESLAWWEGVLFIMAADGSDTKVYSYDGATLTLEDTVTTPAIGRVLGVWNGEIVAAYSNVTSDPVRIRDIGGTWSAPSITLNGEWNAFDIKEFGANVYICGGDDGQATILKWDGTSLTVARSPGGGGACYVMQVFNGELVFVYSSDQPEAGTDWYIGSYDDSTWTNQEKEISADLVSSHSIRGLAVSKGVLILGSYNGSDDGELVAIPGTDLTGTYTTLDTGATVVMLSFGGGLVAA